MKRTIPVWLTEEDRIADAEILEHCARGDHRQSAVIARHMARKWAAIEGELAGKRAGYWLGLANGEERLVTRPEQVNPGVFVD